MSKDERYKVLQDIIKMKTINSNEAEVADYIARLFEGYDNVTTEKVNFAEGRDQLIVDVKGNGKTAKTLGLSGHMDVVPVGDDEWKFDPFSGTIDDGYMYGRGTSDMKGGLVGQVLAVIEMLNDGVEFDGNIRFLLTVGEEVGLIGAKDLTKKGYADNLSSMIIAEPTNFWIAFAHKGVIRPKISATGVAAHGSLPELGVNANDHVVALVNRIQQKFAKNNKENSQMGPSTIVLSLLEGGSAVNVVPDLSTATFDIRTVPEYSNDDVMKDINEAVAELKKEVPKFAATVEITHEASPLFTDENSEIVKVIQAAYKAKTGEDATDAILPGATDGAAFTKAKGGYPIVIFGPRQGELAHQVNERIKLSDFDLYIDMMKDVITGYFR